MTTGVLCAVRGAAETAVVRGIGAGGGQLEVTRRCADLAELLASAAAGLGQVAVLSADLPGLDREAVNHLHGSGVWVVALADQHRGWQGARLRLLGVDVVLEGPDTEQTVAGAVSAVIDAAQRGVRPGGLTVEPGAAPDHQEGATPGDPAPAAPGARAGRPAAAAGSPGAGGTADPACEPDAASRQPGVVIAVWGPTGAPGRTTVALNLAAELAARPGGAGGALIVDADTYGGTVAQMLGLLDEAPGIAAAARAAGTGRLDAVALAGLTPMLDGGLRVLTGISRAARWPEVSASSLEVVWAAARDLAAWTVVDCGFGLEQDEVLSYDTRAPHRNAATLSALAEADVVVVVGGGDPIGLQRLVRGLGDLTDAGVPSFGRYVVVNRVRASASGPHPGAAIRDALLRYAGVTDAHLVPEDRAACDGAVLAARTLREHAPASPARRAVAALAGVIAPVRTGVGAH
ncbi:hypothetical protein [Cellulomonas sp. KRMCY2]|uniref:AAA family ATPase n=1 Tax=Cellulomonas sp. KRMCY2 TaxID=1304865 RepID=UPI00045E6A74|nr:hypothetical protein [Cellulomonas sp. KRMCY2]